MCKTILALVLATFLTLLAPSHNHHKTIHTLNDATPVSLTTGKIRPLKQAQKVKTASTPPAPVNPPASPAPVAEVVTQPAPVQALPSYDSTGCYIGLLQQYSWNVQVARAICLAESSGIATKENAGDYHVICYGSRGLFQIGCDSTADYAGMFDPAANIRQAYMLYANRGWQPWTTYTSGLYLQYL